MKRSWRLKKIKTANTTIPPPPPKKDLNRIGRYSTKHPYIRRGSIRIYHSNTRREENYVIENNIVGWQPPM